MCGESEEVHVSRVHGNSSQAFVNLFSVYITSGLLSGGKNCCKLFIVFCAVLTQWVAKSCTTIVFRRCNRESISSLRTFVIRCKHELLLVMRMHDHRRDPAHVSTLCYQSTQQLQTAVRYHTNKFSHSEGGLAPQIQNQTLWNTAQWHLRTIRVHE